MSTLTLKKSKTNNDRCTPEKAYSPDEIDSNTKSSNDLIEQRRQAKKRVNKALNWLMTFPVFREDPVPPLKYLINKDLFELMGQCEFSRTNLRKAITIKVGKNYASRLIKGAVRHDLQMNEAGRVEK